MNAVKVRLRLMDDEELAAAGVWTSVCHGKGAPQMLVRIAFGFARNGVARPAGAITFWAAALSDEAGNDSVECQSVIESFFN